MQKDQHHQSRKYMYLTIGRGGVIAEDKRHIIIRTKGTSQSGRGGHKGQNAPLELAITGAARVEKAKAEKRATSATDIY
jgi:hypothetical protein